MGKSGSQASLVSRLGGWRPVKIVAQWYVRRPFLTTWVVLALGMVVMLVVFGRDTGLTLRQHATLAVITVGLAALCTWIIFLEHAGPPADGEAG
jgi:hypothetical protein